MEGISKERLIDELEISCEPFRRDVINELIDECTELNPWMPIESAPDEGSFLVYMPEEKRKIQVAEYHPNVNTIGNNFAFDLTKPTHWCELPDDPK